MNLILYVVGGEPPAIPIPGSVETDFVFMDNNVRIYAVPDAWLIGQVYEDTFMQYNLTNRAITIGETQLYGQEKVNRIIAMSDNEILLERSMGAYTANDDVTYTDAMEWTLLRAGTQADLDYWKDAREFHEALAELQTERGF